MMRSILPTIFACLLLSAPSAAQLQLPRTNAGAPPVGGILGDVTDRLGNTLRDAEATASREALRLLRSRDRALARLLRQNADVIERDRNGDLAKRGELLAVGLNEVARLSLIASGFTSTDNEEIEGLGISVTRLTAPEKMDLADAQDLAQSLAPNADISADNLHFQAGTTAPNASSILPFAALSAQNVGVEVGVIDGAPGASVRVASEKGFANGAPRPSDHGTAVASLLRIAGVSRIRVADIYGNDPSGGNALALARALGWLTASGSKVVTISLVGPRNSLVERAVKAAQDRGVIIVAAVGNDGPAAPPAYPASYSNVVSVTGVDRRNRALIEAGSALDLDYSAPGADVYAHDMQGRIKRWRGTSFAAPLVAARVANALETSSNWRSRLDSDAKDLGTRGRDDIFGRGLLCELCARGN